MYLLFIEIVGECFFEGELLAFSLPISEFSCRQCHSYLEQEAWMLPWYLWEYLVEKSGILQNTYFFFTK